MKTIKSRTRDTKANKIDEQEDFGTPKRRLKVVRGGRAATPSQLMFKTASEGFYKTNFRKSTSMSNENDAENSEKRRTRSRQPDPGMPGEITRLISDASVKFSALQNREDIRKKLANFSAKPTSLYTSATSLHSTKVTSDDQAQGSMTELRTRKHIVLRPEDIKFTRR